MTLYRELGQPRLAILYGKQAVAAYEAVRAGIQGLGQASDRSFVDSKVDAYRSLADLLIAAGRLPERSRSSPS